MNEWIHVKTNLLPDQPYFDFESVTELLGVEPYVLAYWESEFPEWTAEALASGQRVYSRRCVQALMALRYFLYDQRDSIEGARQKIAEWGLNPVVDSPLSETLSGQESSLIEPPAPLEQAEESLLESLMVPPDVEWRLRCQILAQELKKLSEKPICDLFHLSTGGVF